MFDFGRPEDTAEVIYSAVLKKDGPGIPDCHWDEMKLEDLEKAFAYMYMAVMEAMYGGASEPVFEVLLAEYDKIFEHLAASSEDFKEAVRSHRHRIVTGTTEESVLKYHRLAGLEASES